MAKNIRIMPGDLQMKCHRWLKSKGLHKGNVLDKETTKRKVMDYSPDDTKEIFSLENINDKDKFKVLCKRLGIGDYIKKKEKAKNTYSKKESDDFLASYEWRSLRMVVIKKYGNRCMCCGAIPSKDNDVVINVDHIKPRKTHPELALEVTNLQILCSPCNHGKGNWDSTDWRQK